MFSPPHRIDRLGRQRHDMKPVVDDLLLRQRKYLHRRFDIGRTHVHRNRFHRVDPGLGKLGTCGDSHRGVVAIADRFDRAVIQIVAQREVDNAQSEI